MWRSGITQDEEKTPRLSRPPVSSRSTSRSATHTRQSSRRRDEHSTRTPRSAAPTRRHNPEVTPETANNQHPVENAIEQQPDPAVQVVERNADGSLTYRATGAKLFKKLDNMFDSDYMSDLELTILSSASVTLKLHQAIVCAQSTHIQKLVDALANPMHKVCLVVPVDIKHPLDMVLNSIHFMYTGKIKISDDNVFQYFTISKELGISGLTHFCEEHIGTAISPNSCLDMLESAKSYQSPELQKRCVQYFKEHAEDIIKLYIKESSLNPKDSASLENLSEDSIIDLLSKNFKIKEIMVFNFVLKWGKAQIKKQGLEETILSKMIENIVPFVRFVSLSRQQLEEYVMPLNVVPKKMLIEVCFRKLNFQYSIPPAEQKTSEDRRARDAYGVPRKFYLRPRMKNWLKLEDFEHEGQYAEYCKSVLEPGMLLRAVRTYENVLEGDIGEFVQHNAGYPPCQVNWRLYGNTYWLYWRDLEIVD